MNIHGVDVSKILKHDWFDHTVFGTDDPVIRMPVADAGRLQTSASDDDPDLCPPWRWPHPPLDVGMLNALAGVSATSGLDRAT